MTKPSDDRSRVAKALGWASQIISICMAMVVPALLGAWADRYFGTRVVFLLLGLALGIALAVLSLIRLTKSIADVSKRKRG